MEAVCCRVRKQVTSLSLFFLAPLRVSPSLSFFFSHFPPLPFSLRLSLTLSLCLFLSAPSSLRSVHADTLDWVCRSHGLQSLTRIQCLRLCVCARKCVCVWVCLSVSSSIDEIWAVKYECWVYVPMPCSHVTHAWRSSKNVRAHIHTRTWRSVCMTSDCRASVVLFCITFAIHLSVILATHTNTHTEAGPGFRLHWL